MEEAATEATRAAVQKDRRVTAFILTAQPIVLCIQRKAYSQPRQQMQYKVLID